MTETLDACCPHCGILVAFGEEPRRCWSCRLLIGRGRATPFHATDRTPRRGSAGFAANAARNVDAEPIDPAVVSAALRHRSDQLGVPVARLRMTDYQDARGADRAGASHGGPSLAQVLATCTTWKAARQQAAAAGDA